MPDTDVGEYKYVYKRKGDNYRTRKLISETSPSIFMVIKSRKIMLEEHALCKEQIRNT